MWKYLNILVVGCCALATTARADIACVQAKLNALGLDPGAADGMLGKRTLSAAARYATKYSANLPGLSKDSSNVWCAALTERIGHTPKTASRSRRSVLKLFDYSSAEHCLEIDVHPAPTGRVIDRKYKRLTEALYWFNHALNTAKGDSVKAKLVASELTKLASKRSFVRLNWRGKGPSPAHWQTNLLKNVAFTVNVLDHHEAWQPGQRKKVVRWGNKLYTNSHYTLWGRKQSHRWPDTVATASAAYISWGLVAPNSTALQEGRRDFNRVARRLKSKGGTKTFFRGGLHRSHFPASWGVRLEDKMLGDLVISAHVAGRAGIDLFNFAPSGVSLYEAIVGWQATLFSDDRKAFERQDMSFLTTDGHERSWSWTEYFIFNYPDDPRTKTLREKSESIKAFGGSYNGLATGPSTCLLR